MLVRGFSQKLTTAYALAGCGVSHCLGAGQYFSCAPDGRGEDMDGVTIPIQPLAVPLRRQEPEQTPLELRRAIREFPQQVPAQRSRKPARTQFADMDLPSPAG